MMTMMSHATNACRRGRFSLADKLIGHFDCNQFSKPKSTFTTDLCRPGSHLWWKMKREVHTELNIVRTFTQQDVCAFTTLTGDENPIHGGTIISPGGTTWRKRSDSDAFDGVQQPSVVPGILLASLFPSLIGTHYPGSLYLNQTLKFRNQVLVSRMFEIKINTADINF
jgi:hypothetical protein